MRASRRKMEAEWRDIGSRAFRMGLKLEAVETKSEGVNRLIREGYEAARKREDAALDREKDMPAPWVEREPRE